MTLTAALYGWAAACTLTTATWAALARRRNRRRQAARTRYTAEALREARQRITAQHAAQWLQAHQRAVTDGHCTADCPTALDWQLQLTAPAHPTVMGRG